LHGLKRALERDHAVLFELVGFSSELQTIDDAGFSPVSECPLAQKPSECHPRQMKLRAIFLMVLGLGLGCTLPSMAQERGNWRAASKTARSITGDVTFSGEKLTINFLSLPIAEIRSLMPAEISAAFDGADASAGTGHLYRLSIPGDKRFLHKNTLCGSEETQWMATYVSGKDLEIAFFSNATPPLFTPDALNNSANLCGTYSYVR
jgi:hypothetical protein